MGKRNIGQAAVIISGSVLSLAYLTGMIVSQVYKHNNPQGVDINYALAYLGEILKSSFVVGGVVMIGALVTTALAWRQGDRGNARLAVILLLIQLGVFAVLGVVRAIFPTP